MIQRRLRVLKWLTTTPVVGVCTRCSREFKVPMSALRRTAEAQASLQEQFDRHKSQPEDTRRGTVRGTADVLLREEPEEDEEEDDRSKKMMKMTTKPTMVTRRTTVNFKLNESPVVYVAVRPVPTVAQSSHSHVAEWDVRWC